MMKKMMFVLMVLVGSVFVAQAQDVPTPSNEAVSTEQQDDKVKIKSEDLPDAVKKSLEAEDYKGWLINAAYHNEKKDTYEVELKNGAETKTVKFNKDGEVID